MSEQLKPCPFCGATDKTGLLNICVSPAKDIYENEMVDFFTVKCHGCGTKIGNYYTTEEAAQHWNRRASGWISVENRLPNNYNEVLCLRKEDEDNVILAYSPKGYWYGNGYIFRRNSITHWQPLPEPPEVEK